MKKNIMDMTKEDITSLFQWLDWPYECENVKNVREHESERVQITYKSIKRDSSGHKMFLRYDGFLSFGWYSSEYLQPVKVLSFFFLNGVHVPGFEKLEEKIKPITDCYNCPLNNNGGGWVNVMCEEAGCFYYSETAKNNKSRDSVCPKNKGDMLLYIFDTEKAQNENE